MVFAAAALPVIETSDVSKVSKSAAALMEPFKAKNAADNPPTLTANAAIDPPDFLDATLLRLFAAVFSRVALVLSLVARVALVSELVNLSFVERKERVSLLYFETCVDAFEVSTDVFFVAPALFSSVFVSLLAPVSAPLVALVNWFKRSDAFSTVSDFTFKTRLVISLLILCF